jgi:hypothetical protein
VSDSKLSFKDIENMSSEERSKLKDKDYKHLGSVERQKVKIMIKTASKPSAHEELMGGKNTSVNTSEGGNGNTNEYVDGNVFENKDGNAFVNVGEMARKIKAANNQKKKKPKFEETHTKDTLWIRNDLFEAFNEICTERGDKTKFINEAIYLLLVQKEKDTH